MHAEIRVMSPEESVDRTILYAKTNGLTADQARVLLHPSREQLLRDRWDLDSHGWTPDGQPVDTLRG